MSRLRNSIEGVARTVRSRGMPGLAAEVAKRAVDGITGRLDLTADGLPVRPEDLADSSTLPPPAAVPAGGQKLRIGWVCAPPAAGSGGHTTLFRMVEMAEKRGHECTLFLYDRNSDDVSRHAAVVRAHWPALAAGISSATAGMRGMDAVVASSWGAAHVVARRAPETASRFYFIQDFEPYFYPRGALYSFAEDTYRFGFTNIALGPMIAGRLRAEIGVEPYAVVPFGSDDVQYRLLPADPAAEPRTGIVYYAKRSVDRRGYLLAKLAFEEFHRLHPGQEIHVVGDRISNWSVPVTNHGTLSPRDLNILYNRTIAGLSLSFTNISLVPEELMAAGNVPVLNDHGFAREVLAAPQAIWARPTPAAIAAGLSQAVTDPDIDGRARLLSARQGNGWTATAVMVAEIIESVCATPGIVGPAARVLEQQQ